MTVRLEISLVMFIHLFNSFLGSGLSVNLCTYYLRTKILRLSQIEQLKIHIYNTYFMFDIDNAERIFLQNIISFLYVKAKNVIHNFVN